MPTITTRLTLWYVGIFGAIIIAVAGSMYTAFEQQRREAMDADLRAYADLLLHGLAGETADISDLFDELLQARMKPKLRMRGHTFVLASKDSIVFETNVLAEPDSIINALPSDSMTTVDGVYRTIKLNDAHYRTFTKRIERRQGSFQLTVIASLERLDESLDQLQLALGLILPAALLLAGAGGWFIARRALRPVRNITSTAASISSSNLDQRVPIGRSRDELAVLAETFNEMISRLDQTFKSQQQFIADASHDLRTPLTVVQMELELLLLSRKSEVETQAALERSLIEVDRLNRLASDLLLLARADAHQLTLDRKNFRLDELLMECVSQLRNLAESKKITFRVEIDAPAEVQADEILLRRAIVNILDNAIKFSPESGVIALALIPEEQRVGVRVTDGGPGVAEAELPKLFDRFHRGDAARTTKGTGLGLAIVRAILLAHSGSVEASSRVGEGTTITFFIPR